MEKKNEEEEKEMTEKKDEEIIEEESEEKTDEGKKEEEKKVVKSPIWLFYLSIGLSIVFAIFVGIFGKNWKYIFILIPSGSIGFFLKFYGFGFTCTFSSILKERNFHQYREMLYILAGTTLIITIFRKLDLTSVITEDSYVGSESEISLSLLIGSFIFGIGMQIASMCASGTLVCIGGGSIGAVIVLVFFIISATVFTTNPLVEFWKNDLPSWKVISFYLDINVFGGIAITFLICGLIITGTYIYDYYINKYMKTMIDSKRQTLQEVKEIISEDIEGETGNDPSLPKQEDKEKEKEKESEKKINVFSFVLEIFIFILSFSLFFPLVGSCIGVMGPFAFVGANILKIFGIEESDWNFLKGKDFNLMHNAIFISDISMILGAFICVSYRQKFGLAAFNKKVVIKSILGGTLLGIGSRMSYGCNIGSMFSGITSTSLHGWIWMAFAILGSFLGIKINGWIF